MRNTDKAAQAILTYESIFSIAELSVVIQDGTEDDGNHGDLICDFSDLQAMAKLWLMIPHIIDASGHIDGGEEIQAMLDSLGVDTTQIQHDLWDGKIKLKALEAEEIPPETLDTFQNWWMCGDGKVEAE